MALIKINIQTCIICENLSHNGQTHKVCTTKYTPDFSLSMFKHTKTAKQIILNSKNHPYSYTDIKKLLKTAQAKDIIQSTQNRTDLVIPIPESVNIFTKRTTNLPILIAETIAKSTQIKVIKALKRSLFVLKKQKNLKREERMINVKKIIKYNNYYTKQIIGKRILIVDDITTTGATLLYSTKLLKEHGAKSIWCLTVTKDILES